MEWQALSSALLIALQSTLGNMVKRHQDLFDDNAADIRSLIHDRNAAHVALLRNPTSHTLYERFSSMRATVQHKLRWMENNWWAAQIQSYANINDTKSFYEALMGVCWPSRFSLHPVRCTDGVLIKNKEYILKRWVEYHENLLSKVHTTDPGFLDDLPIIPKLDDPPSFDDVVMAILCLRDNKTAGPDNIPAEVIKNGDTEGCVILSLTAGPLNVSPSNGKMPTLFLYANKRVTEQNVATVVAFPFSLLQAKCWQKSCSSIFSSMLLILSCLNLNAGSGVDAAQLT